MTLLARAACVALLAMLLTTPALAQSSAEPEDDDEPPPPSSSVQPGDALPPADLSPEVLYGYLVAEIALQRGSAGLAAQTFVELAKRTRDPRIARRAVEVANVARLRDLALEGARVWYEVNPGSPQALQSLTVLLIGARRVDEAEPLLEKLLASDGPAAANGFMQLGRLLASNPDRKQNLEVVARLARKHRKLPEAHFAVAQAAIAAEDEGRALAAVREASRLRPEWELPALFEAQVLQRSKPDAAIARLAAFLARNPDSREVRLNYARALVGERKYDEARAEFEKLVAANPANPDLIYAVGLLAVQAREYGVAEGNLRRALELGFRDANAARFTLGQIAEERKDFAAARDWYRSVTPGDHYLPSRVRYAQTLSREGNLDEARRFLRLQAAGEAQATPFVIAEAQILRDAGKHSDAYDLLGQALAKSPDQAELLYDHALTAEKLDRFDVLESNLRKLIQMQPKHAHAYNALGYSLADRNLRLDEAKTLIEKALELAPDDAAIVDSMGWVLYRMGDLKGAIQFLRRAFRGRQDGEIAAHLGEVLWMSGEREEASRIWDETLKNHPADEILLKTIQRLRK